MRAGTSTFWPNGGTSANTFEELTNIVAQICCYNFSTKTWSTKEVGCAEPNGWGIYDPVTGSLVLDAVTPSTNKMYPKNKQSGGIDPVGNSYSVGSYIARVVKIGSDFYMNMPASRFLTYAKNKTTGVISANLDSRAYNCRLAIHLKPLNFGD